MGRTDHLVDNNIKTAEYKQGLVLYVKESKQETVTIILRITCCIRHDKLIKKGFLSRGERTELQGALTLSNNSVQYKLYLTKRPSRPPLRRTFFQAGLRPMLFINSRLPKYR